VNHVVMFSGGISSWASARRVVQRFGTENVTLLFADTLIEDWDSYRFIGEAAYDLGLPVTRIADGRTPFEVFRDVKFLGNTQVDPCSRVLKRDLLDRWISERFTPDEVRVYTGLTWEEEHRQERIAERKLPYVYLAPLCDAPYLSKSQTLALAQSEGLTPPRLYDMGFSHANCGGGCVKAGIGHFANLLDKLPHVFEEWEKNENAMRGQLGDVSMLKDRRGGMTRPLPLTQLRRRIEADEKLTFDEQYEIGGCACAIE
jgi:hypothetical protein